MSAMACTELLSQHIDSCTGLCATILQHESIGDMRGLGQQLLKQNLNKLCSHCGRLLPLTVAIRYNKMVAATELILLGADLFHGIQRLRGEGADMRIATPFSEAVAALRPGCLNMLCSTYFGRHSVGLTLDHTMLYCNLLDTALLQHNVEHAEKLLELQHFFVESDVLQSIGVETRAELIYAAMICDDYHDNARFTVIIADVFQGATCEILLAVARRCSNRAVPSRWSSYRDLLVMATTHRRDLIGENILRLLLSFLLRVSPPTALVLEIMFPGLWAVSRDVCCDTSADICRMAVHIWDSRIIRSERISPGENESLFWDMVASGCSLRADPIYRDRATDLVATVPGEILLKLMLVATNEQYEDLISSQYRVSPWHRDKLKVLCLIALGRVLFDHMPAELGSRLKARLEAPALLLLDQPELFMKRRHVLRTTVYASFMSELTDSQAPDTLARWFPAPCKEETLSLIHALDSAHRKGWRPIFHKFYPPEAQAICRKLLLVHHRLREMNEQGSPAKRSREGSVCVLPYIPIELWLRIIEFVMPPLFRTSV